MSDLKILLPPGKAKQALERKPELKEQIEDPENQARLVDAQIQVQEAFLNDPELYLESLNSLIKHLPLSQRRVFVAAFAEIRKKQEVVKDILSDLENYTNGEIDPIKAWKAVAYRNPNNNPERIPRSGEITIIPDPRFLRFRLERNEIFDESFNALAGVMPLTNIRDLDGFVMIEGKDTDIDDIVIDHEFEHVIQHLVLNNTQKEEEKIYYLLKELRHIIQFFYFLLIMLVDGDEEQNFYSQDYNFKPEQIEKLTNIIDDCVKKVLSISIRNEFAAHLAGDYGIELVANALKTSYTNDFKSEFYIAEQQLREEYHIYRLVTSNPAEAANIEKLKELYHKILEERLDKRIPEIIEKYRQEASKLSAQGRDLKWIAVWLRNKVLDPDLLQPLASSAKI